MDEVLEKSRLRCLLAHFGAIEDPREPAKIRYPLSEVLFLVVAATIAGVTAQGVGRKGLRGRLGCESTYV